MKMTFLAVALLAAASQAQTTVFYEDFESGASNWSMEGLWRVQDASESCASGQVPFPSGTHCMWYGSLSSYGCSYALSPNTIQHLTHLPTIALPTTTGSIVLSYQSWADTENSFEWDMHGVQVREVGSTTWSELLLSFNSSFWRLDSRDLTPWAGKTIELRFFFNAVDGFGNLSIGAFIDDVRITEIPDSTLTFTTCAADGSWVTRCPCDGVSTTGRGCPSSFSPTGAGLSASGSLYVSNDTLTMHMDGLSVGVATLFQATGRSYMPAANLAGDGVSCVTGPFVRLVSRFAPGGVLNYPGAGDVSISALGFVQPGQTRYYAVRYRDPVPFCQAATFNVSNTISAFWRP